MGPPPQDLDLIRLALVTFTPKPMAWRAWRMQTDGIEVAPLSAYEGDQQLKLLVCAKQTLRYRPKVTGDNEVVVPPKQRNAAEEAIETVANLIAVAQGCRRHIASPWPPVVFVATDDDGRSWLQERAGLQHGRLRRIVRAAEQIKVGEAVMNDLNDRTDGVALRVEALAHDHAMGRFHEFIRLFERGFHRPSKKLVTPLHDFLDERFGYTEDELRKWFEEFRDPATHADARQQFLLETDVQAVVDRMEQAAHDVLLNKKIWRDPSSDRRNVWTPSSGSHNADGGVFVTQGTTPPSLAVRILDEYDAFPMDLAGVVVPRPPDWWPHEDAPSSRTAAHEMRVSDAGE